MITIDAEARQQKRLPTSLDRFAPRYKTANGYFTFTSPSMWTIEKNLWFLLRNSVEKQFESKYLYRPDYLSYDEYGTVTLSSLLMYLNGVFSLEDFNLTKVIIPTYSAIVDICQDNYPSQDVDDMTEILW